MPSERGTRRAGGLARGCSTGSGAMVICPLTTADCRTQDEVNAAEVPEIRAYKLGKKRWSYNQVELKFHQVGGSQTLEVVEAMQYGTPTLSEEEKEAGVTYQVRLTNGYRIRVNIFIVYDAAKEVSDESGQKRYRWPSVSRAQCKKDCEGQVLRSIQRFGRLGKRSGNLPPDAQNGKDKIKEAKYLYLSIDEAGTHVGVRRFRMVAGAYDHQGQVLLGTTMSMPIWVLANNDVPTGAAFISLDVPLRGNWEGWSMAPQKALRLHSHHLVDGSGGLMPAMRENSRSLSSNETGFNLAAAIDSRRSSYRSYGSLPGMLLSHAMASGEAGGSFGGSWGPGPGAGHDGDLLLAKRMRFLGAEEEHAAMLEYSDIIGSVPAMGLSPRSFDAAPFPLLPSVQEADLQPDFLEMRMKGGGARPAPLSPDLSSISNATAAHGLSPELAAHAHNRSRDAEMGMSRDIYEAAHMDRLGQGGTPKEAMLHGRYNGYGGLDFAAPPISPLHFGVANPFDLPFPHFPGATGGIHHMAEGWFLDFGGRTHDSTPNSPTEQGHAREHDFAASSGGMVAAEPYDSRQFSTNAVSATDLPHRGTPRGQVTTEIFEEEKEEDERDIEQEQA